MRKISLLLTLLLTTFIVKAQFVEIEGVKGFRFNGVHPIYSGEAQEIAGYYTYYFLEKGDKGFNTFEFSIVNKDLSDVVKAQVEMHRSATINNTVFNGKCMLLSYNDRKNKQVKLNIIDNTGKIIAEQSLPMENRFLTTSEVYADATGNGFYIVKPVKGKKVLGYTITKVNNNLEELWQVEQVPDKGQQSVEDLVNNKDRFIVWENTNFTGKLIKPIISCYNAKTGEKIYERDAYDGTSTLLYNELRINKNGEAHLGGAYVDGQKLKSVNTSGIYMLKLDLDGKDIVYTKVNNEENIQTVLKETSTGFTVGSKEKILVEDVLINDEYTYIVSEMFRKNVNATPWRIQWTRDLLTGKYIGEPDAANKHTSKWVFDILDFIIFKFNNEGELVEIKPIAKEKKNKITIWDPYYNYGGMKLARILKAEGWFDYAFSEQDANGDFVMICKDNAEGESNGKSIEGELLSQGPKVYMYTLNDDYPQKTVNLKQQGKLDLEQGRVGYFNVLRNTDDKVAVVYYQRKLKKISISLEATN